MAQTLKISDECMQQLRSAAEVNHRSLAGQAEYWMRLGKAFEAHPQAGFETVQLALKGQLSVDTLDEAERRSFFEMFQEAVAQPSDDEVRFFEQRREREAAVRATGRQPRKKVAASAR